jgi:hypothetical protein
MKLVDMEPGWTAYTQLASTALAVIARRVDGWAMYVGGVPGFSHDAEWQRVLDFGDKLDEGTATAVAHNRFYPSIDVEGLNYCD